VQGLDVCIVWIRAVANAEWIQEGIVEPLTKVANVRPTADVIFAAISASSLTSETTYPGITRALTDGKAIIMMDQSKHALIADVSQPPSAAIDKPQNESSISGPQEAFVGALATDIGMIRKRLRSHQLKVESFRLGVRTHTVVALMYFEGIINSGYLDTVKQRLDGVQLDHVLSTNYIREIIRDHRMSVFPTMEVTERPDKVVAALLEGKFIIHVDGSPQSVIAPTTFLGFLNSVEDYYQNFLITIFVRFLRQVCFWASMLLPALYISLLSFNHDLIPTPLLVNIARQHTGIPFPTVVETFLMVFAFEALREAGIRLPKTVGQSVSIVGALVIGEASVSAGIVSPGAVIVVAVTGVASFTIVSVEMANANRLLEFLFMAVASIFGIYGVVILGTTLILHMVTLESYGVPYMAPYAPLRLMDMKDAAVRAPWWAIRTRPSVFQPQDVVRNDSSRPELGKRRS